MNLIEKKLRQTIGLHAPTIGCALIERTVRLRMRANGLTKPADYLLLLEHSTTEWDVLLESLVVPETWFFRNTTPFLAMTRIVTQDWLPVHRDGILRLLSLPCASGEEPYSMAMALLDAGLPESRFQIDAIDISARALAHAGRAVYGKNSFRGAELNFRDRFFQSTRDGFALKEPVRRLVRFHRGNVLDAGCPPGVGGYDFVFCRNLLIYFDEATQKKTLSKLHSLLASSGVLFVGPAEMPVALGHGFAPTNMPLSFACRKINASPKPEPSRVPAWSMASARAAVPLPRTMRTAAIASGTLLLARARALLDEGRLPEAVDICETYLRERGASAEAFYLLGVARHGSGANSQADQCYRKALYLEPNHYDALVQWAQLSARTGNDNHARILQERAERVRKQA
jgi:chemotaxis protein methyltransferase WspC